MFIGSFFSAHLKEAGELTISQKVLPNNQASLHEKGEIVLAMKEGGKEGTRNARPLSPFPEKPMQSM